MFAARARIARRLASGVRRISSATSTGVRSSSSSFGLFASVALAAGATTAAALALHNNNIAACQAAAKSSGAAKPAAVVDEEIKYYQPTSSRKSQLPQTPEEIAKFSHSELAAIYDPAANHPLAPLTHGLVWGTLPPPAGLEPIELLFTKEDTDPMHRHMELLVRTIQDRICNDLIDVENMDTYSTLTTSEPLSAEHREMLLSQGSQPGQFRQDITIRPGGTGGGVTRVLQGGRVFSKAGVSVSVANVKPPPQALARLASDHPRLKQHLDIKEPYSQFTAAVSLVLHPVSPNVPTVHANYRIFDLTLPTGERYWWFGGGSDLTPSIVNDTDARHFHTEIKKSLDKIDSGYYPSWKKWADEYFYLKHRNEARGIGGVFFDDLHERSLEHYETVVRRLGQSFSAQYFPIVLKRKDLPFNEADLAFQQLRRGRYVEYNLVYDKGTTYGLNMLNSRPDAVLMSLPPITRFTYKQPFATKEQQYTKEVLTNPKEWC